MISNQLLTRRGNTATQEYLRFELHLKPFIENIDKSVWNELNIPNYGKIYKKINK